MIDATGARPGPPERRIKRRTVTVQDLVVLVAGVALGAAWWRAVSASTTTPLADRYSGPLSNAPYFTDLLRCHQMTTRIGDQILPFVQGLMAAVLVARFSPRRPARSSLNRQSGWVACLAGTACFAVQWLFLGLMFITIHATQDASMRRLFLPGVFDLVQLRYQISDPGLYVVAAWLTQRVVQRRVGAVDWVDRTGRLLGWICVALACIRIGIGLGLNVCGASCI